MTTASLRSSPDPGFACGAAVRRSFALGGLTLRALEWPAAGQPPLCLLHGGSAHAHWFDAVVPALRGRYHILSLDQRGHGESDWAEGSAYATENFAADLLGVMEALGWTRMALVGHSMGGHNAMAFAAWHPERLSALCVVDSRPTIPADRLHALHRRGHRGPRRHDSLDAALRSFKLLPPETTAAPALLDHLGRQGIVERDGRFLYRFDPDCNGSRRPVDAWPLLPLISAPTLLVRGEHSPILPAQLAGDMASRIPGARVAEIPRAHHHLVLDEPARFAEVLGEFLSRSG
jgi:pimeloyl-ACP methyl ester carboxylesterase